MKARILSFIVSICMIFSMVSCSSNTPNTDDTTVQSFDTTTAPEEESSFSRENTPDTLPDDLDFDNAVIRIACRDIELNISELTADEDGDVLENAVYTRNLLVEERLNVQLEAIPVHSVSPTMMEIIRTALLADARDYDLLSMPQYTAVQIVTSGLLTNLIDAPYVDYDQPWWWSDYNRETQIGNSAMYIINGDISLSSIQYISAMYFNKRLLTDQNLITPDELYELVLDGGWTYDKFFELSNATYHDLNGDGERDENDQYGIAVAVSTTSDHFTFTANNTLSKFNDKHIPTLTVNNEHFINYMQTLYNLYYNSVGTRILERDSLVASTFAENKTLFIAGYMQHAGMLREMEDEYGVITYPKYDEDQEYQSLVHDAAAVFCVPINCEKYDAVCATMEAMAAQNYRTVVPALYEQVLKAKYQSDSTVGKLLDIMKNAARTDFAYAYNYAVNNAGLLCRTMLRNQSPDFASTWATLESKAQLDLQDLIDAFTNLEN